MKVNNFLFVGFSSKFKAVGLKKQIFLNTFNSILDITIFKLITKITFLLLKLILKRFENRIYYGSYYFVLMNSIY